MTEEQIEIINNNGLVVVYVGAVWCAPCVSLKPVLKRLLENIGGKIIELDLDIVGHDPEWKHLRSIPFVQIFRNGQMQEQGNYRWPDLAAAVKGHILEGFYEWLIKQEATGYAYRRYKIENRKLMRGEKIMGKIIIPDNFFTTTVTPMDGDTYMSFIDPRGNILRSDSTYYVDEDAEIHENHSDIKPIEEWDELEKKIADSVEVHLNNPLAPADMEVKIEHDPIFDKASNDKLTEDLKMAKIKRIHPKKVVESLVKKQKAEKTTKEKVVKVAKKKKG